MSRGTGHSPRINVTDRYTATGRAALAAHEGRRKTALRLGFDAYLKPAELQGAAVKRCGEICRKEEGDAEKALLKYLDDLQETAINQFKRYHRNAQSIISDELQLFEKGDHGAVVGYYNIKPILKPNPPLRPRSAPNLIVRVVNIYAISRTAAPVSQPDCIWIRVCDRFGPEIHVRKNSGHPSCNRPKSSARYRPKLR